MAAFIVHQPTLVTVTKLNPAAYNPRAISEKKYAALKANIKSEGFLEPLVVQQKGMGIIGGHQRLRAVKDLSAEAGELPPALPAYVLDIDDRRAKKLNMKLNSLKGEFDAVKLGQLLVDLYEGDDDPPLDVTEAALLGFSLEEANQFVHLINPPEDTEPDDPKGFGRSITLSIEFQTVKERDRVKKLLTERAVVEKKKTGDVLARMFAPKKKLAKSRPRAHA